MITITINIVLSILAGIAGTVSGGIALVIILVVIGGSILSLIAPIFLSLIPILILLAPLGLFVAGMGVLAWILGFIPDGIEETIGVLASGELPAMLEGLTEQLSGLLALLP